MAGRRLAGATQSWRAAVRGALRRITWRATGAALALGLGMSVWLTAEIALYLDPQQSLAVQSVSTLCISVLMTFSLMFTTFVADELVAAGTGPFTTYGWAIVIGSAVGALAQWALHAALGIPTFNDYPGAAAEIVAMQPATVFFRYLICGTIVVWVYVSRRAELRATARLDAAQVRRSENERRMLQARLQALQAQIEPEFLQNTLARVRDRYESDPATAGTMLDRLIVYLRSALPQLRDSQSTLEREISLVSAYVAVIRASVDDTVVVAAEIPASLQDARMPPMVLLPLVECFLVHLRAQRTGAGTLRICAQASPARMRIEVFASGPAFSSRLAGTGLDVIRERLRALYGERGGLELARAGSRGVTATIEIPR